MKKIWIGFIAFCLVVSLFAFVGCTGETKLPEGEKDTVPDITTEDMGTKQEEVPQKPVQVTEQETDPDGGLWSPEV